MYHARKKIPSDFLRKPRHNGLIQEEGEWRRGWRKTCWLIVFAMQHRYAFTYVSHTTPSHMYMYVSPCIIHLHRTKSGLFFFMGGTVHK